MNNKERYNQVIREVFEMDADAAINEAMTRADNEKWTSLLHLTFVTSIEDEFDIMLDTEDILALQSYAAGLEIVNKYNPED